MLSCSPCSPHAVAMGAACSLQLTPGGAIIVGMAAGALSVCGYQYLTPLLDQRFGLGDTCGEPVPAQTFYLPSPPSVNCNCNQGRCAGFSLWLCYYLPSDVTRALLPACSLQTCATCTACQQHSPLHSCKSSVSLSCACSPPCHPSRALAKFPLLPSRSGSVTDTPCMEVMCPDLSHLAPPLPLYPASSLWEMAAQGQRGGPAPSLPLCPVPSYPAPFLASIRRA